MAAMRPEMVAHVARLACLQLEGEALTRLASQLDEILDYVRQLQTVATDQVEPTTHVLPLSNVLRKDALRPSLPQETVTALAPAAQPPFIAVPKVIIELRKHHANLNNA